MKNFTSNFNLTNAVESVNNFFECHEKIKKLPSTQAIEISAEMFLLHLAKAISKVEDTFDV